MNPIVYVLAMKSKVQQKNKAIEMRKRGASYSDILKEVPVAKSSLSLWLKNIPLTEDEKAVLKKRKDANISRGRIKAAAANRKNRLDRQEQAFSEARKVFECYKTSPTFLTGIALYWAEGSKRSYGFQFINSDEDMINFMISWSEKYLNVPKDDIMCRLYTHAFCAHEGHEEYWSRVTGIPISNFKKTIHKTEGLGVKKRPNYKGCLRLELVGIGFLWKMKFWKEMLVAYSKETL